MKLDNITIKEAESFIAELTPKETKSFNIESELTIRTSVFIKGIRNGSGLSAIGGIAKHYNLFYYPYYIVREEYQGKGIGSELANSNFEFAEKKGILLFVTSVDRQNTFSVYILKKQGYKVITSYKESDYTYVPFSKRGEVIAKLLPIIIRIYLSPFGNILRYWRRKKYHMEGKSKDIVNTSLASVEDFINSLTENEKSYYNLKFSSLRKDAVYIRGYEHNGRLIGIAGIIKKFLVTYHSFRMVKEEYWGQDIGRKMGHDWFQWAKQHHIPCVILQYVPFNPASQKSYSKAGFRKVVKIRGGHYSFALTTKWALPWKYILIALIYCRYLINNRRGEQGE